MSKYDDLEKLAMKVMLSGLKESELLAEYEYKKEKSFEDVKVAIQKGRKKGSGKFETECMEISFALDRVIKKRKAV